MNRYTNTYASKILPFNCSLVLLYNGITQKLLVIQVLVTVDTNFTSINKLVLTEICEEVHMPFEGEQLFKGDKEIKYVFQKSTTSPFLIIVFSAFNPVGAPPAYNYTRTLQPFDINKLFILDDYGERGCYYLGKNRVFDVETSVSKLISWISETNNISKENIIACGSSKGGFAALYFGIKYNYGKVIVGAPQTYLGTYLTKAKAYSTLEYIAGDTSEESVNFLDSLLYNVAAQAAKIPEILIHVGVGDHHYKGHVIPFRNHLIRLGFDCELDVKDYSDHGDVTHYQELLTKKVIEIEPSLKDSFQIVDLCVELKNNMFTINVQANKLSEYALYVLKNNERIKAIWYTQNSQFVYEAQEAGVYSFLAFAKHGSQVISKKTKQYVLP